jgi:hypothetical protein
MLRRLMPIAFVVCAVATAVPAAHAGTKTTPLYFINNGAPASGSCTLEPQLSLRPADANECSGTVSAVNGTGLISDDTYTSAKNVALKVDVSRPLTGTVYIAHFPLLYASAGGVGTPHSLPGYVSLDITYKMDSVKIGTQHIEGVVMPVDGLKAAVSLKLPASLKNKTVKKVTAAVTWTTAVGLSGISYTSPYASVLQVPTR